MAMRTKSKNIKGDNYRVMNPFLDWKKSNEEKQFSITKYLGDKRRQAQETILGPGVGVGVGCGVGLGLGLVGGVGLGGSSWNNLQFVFGVGMGCGVGIGFGYGQGIGYGFDLESLDLES